MAGRLGNKKITIQNLKVLKVDPDNNILLVKGAVPGHKGSMISVFDSVKKKQDIKSNQSENSPITEEPKITQDNQGAENKESTNQQIESKPTNQSVENVTESSSDESDKVNANMDETKGSSSVQKGKDNN